MFYNETIKDQTKQIKDDLKEIFNLYKDGKYNFLLNNIYKYANDQFTISKSCTDGTRSNQEHCNSFSDRIFTIYNNWRTNL